MTTAQQYDCGIFSLRYFDQSLQINSHFTSHFQTSNRPNQSIGGKTGLKLALVPIQAPNPSFDVTPKSVVDVQATVSIRALVLALVLGV